MSKPLFSVVVIAKNEATTLPRLLNSLSEFKQRGGEVCVLDTGSTDLTAKIAREWGCVVEEVGEKFMITIDKETAEKINTKFVVDGEENIVKEGSRLFDFARARNYAAGLASNDMIAMPDCDEIYTKLNIDYVNDRIKEGFEQLEFNFVFAHDAYGRESVKFIQCKMYNKQKMKWGGMVHEVLQGEAKRTLLPEQFYKIEHYQNESTDRKGYLPGLALDCYLHPENDRNSHYLARELLWTGRIKSAIQEFKRHLIISWWDAERSESMMYIGDVTTNEKEKVEWYHKAIQECGNRRKAYIKLASYYLNKKELEKAVLWASASLQIPYTGFYADDMSLYTYVPHEILYKALGWMGKQEESKEHFIKADNLARGMFRGDEQYYYGYTDKGIEGWMTIEELNFLFEKAKNYKTICELGSWKGRSTNALCSGTTGTVTAIDHFLGSIAEGQAHEEAKFDVVYNQFLDNTKEFTNLKVIRDDIDNAVKDIGQYEMIFIDAGHTYEEVKKDILNRLPHTTKLICGHDYCSIWDGVQKAVNEIFGEVQLAGTIWYKYIDPISPNYEKIKKAGNPKVSIVIPSLGRPEKLKRLIEGIKREAGYDNYQIVVVHDGEEIQPLEGVKSYRNEVNLGVPKTVKIGVEKTDGDFVMYLGNDCIPKPKFLLNAVISMIDNFPELDGLIGLNDMYWREGEMFTHWMASKKLLPSLDGEFFHTGYHHCGCDNELTERCRSIGKAVWCKDAKIFHEHPATCGIPTDEIYDKAYDTKNQEEDKALLHKRAKELGFEIRENFTRPNY